MRKTEFLTIFTTYDALSIIQQTLPSVIEECERAGAALIVHDSTDRNRESVWSWLQELSDKHNFFLILSSNLSMAHARNMCLQVGMEMFGPEFICMMEDDHGFKPGLIPELTAAMRQHYGKLSPNGLRYGMFTGCRQCWAHHRFHPTGDGHSYPDENLPPLIVGGTGSCFRCAPTSHWTSVLKGYDPDEYLMSEHQTSPCTLRNYNNGFTAMYVRNGELMFSIERTGRGVTRPVSQWIFDPRYAASDRRSRYVGKPRGPLTPLDADLMVDPPRRASVSNFSVLEAGGDGLSWRWALGPESTVVMDCHADGPVNIDFEFDSPTPQRVEVTWNGDKLDEVPADVPGVPARRLLTAPATEGANWLVFRYSDWNGKANVFAPGDSRAIAVRFTRLRAASGLA